MTMVWAEIIRILASLVAVLGLIGLCAIAARKAGLITAPGSFKRKRRLAIVETLALDAKRRITIIKCDETEHLVVLGPTGETLIEKHLAKPEPALEETAATTPAFQFGTTPQGDKNNPFAILRALQKHRQKTADLPTGDLDKTADAA